MLCKKKGISVAASLMAGIALLLSGGVSPVVGEVLIVEPESIKISKQESLKLSKPKSIKISKQKLVESSTFPKGEYTPAERENPSYDRCAKRKGFDAQLKCAREAIDIEKE